MTLQTLKNASTIQIKETTALRPESMLRSACYEIVD
jgi:hypothetical protein